METNDLYELYRKHPVVQTDTRKLQPGCLFFALSGANFNGNTFAPEAIARGAAYAVIDDAAYAVDDRYLLVPNVLLALQQLAQRHRRSFDIPFIAITGSNGKTTTKELITAVLRKKYVTFATAGNLNNHIGVPLTLLGIGGNAQMAVIEMGANHQREIAGYCEIAMPDYGLITNCGKAHIEGFGGVEGVRKGKGELFDYLTMHGGAIFRNADLPYLSEMAHDITQQITYGTQNADYIGLPVAGGVLLEVDVQQPEVWNIPTNLVGDYNFPNVMAAVAVGMHFGVKPQDIKEAIMDYQPDNSRSQMMEWGTNKVIMDAYNANPSSMAAAIRNFAENNMPEKMLWVGGMKEMGAEELNEHKALVELITQYKWKQVMLVGKEFATIHGNYLWFGNVALARDYVAEHMPEKSSILIKGSRGSKMEVILDAINARVENGTAAARSGNK